MYYLIYGVLYLISLLPLRVLFIAADGVYILIYYIIGYRKDVVMNNLGIAFPEKSHAEKIKIAKQFYRNFIDNFIETIKMLSASDEYLKKRCTGNWELLHDLYKNGKSCTILLGHMFNWELGNRVVSMQIRYKFLVVYMPISNKAINRLFLKLRNKGQTHLLSAHNMRNDMLPFRNQQYALALVADQNPPHPSKAYWLNFFNRPAPFVTGPEKGSRFSNLPVVFCNFEKIRRGYYNVVLTLETENPQLLPEGALTVRYVRNLERAIRQQPDMWLWTHRRWKHNWHTRYAKLWIDDDKPAASDR